MKQLHSCLLILALLSYAVQALAAPFLPGCPQMPDVAAMQDAGAVDNSHHGHPAQAGQDEAPVSDCAADCQCGAGCAHAGQPLVLRADEAANQIPVTRVRFSARPGMLHASYASPLLRPPALL